MLVTTPATVLDNEALAGAYTSISVRVNTSLLVSVSPPTVILTVNEYIPGTEKSKAAGEPEKSAGYVSVNVPPEAFI